MGKEFEFEIKKIGISIFDFSKAFQMFSSNSTEVQTDRQVVHGKDCYNKINVSDRDSVEKTQQMEIILTTLKTGLVKKNYENNYANHLQIK